MTDKPLVSAIVATYNRADIVGQAIESILGQTYKNIEVLVVDDGSTDGTQEALRRFGNRIRVVRQENAGPGAARNRGIEIARGELIAFQDSDDIWLPTKLERQVRLLEKAGPTVPCCLCNAILRFSSGRTTSSFENAPIRPDLEEGIWDNPTQILLTRFILFNQMVIVRRSVLEKLRGFNANFRCLEDYDLALRLSLEGPWAFIREPLAIWNQGSVGSLSAKALAQQCWLKKTEMKVLEGISARVGVGDHPALQKIVRRRIRKVSRELRGVSLIEGGTIGERAQGHALLQVERFRRAIDRRLPSYPKMKVRPIPAVPAPSTGASRDVAIGAS